LQSTPSTIGRRVALIALGSGTLFLAACVSKPVRQANADGTWCHRVGKAPRYKLTCTSAPAPPPAVEADAKRFAASAERVTVYVVRKRWADAANVVELTVDGGARAETVPESFVRMRLPPGDHVLRASWPEGETQMAFRGTAGEIRVIELAGSAWAWGSTYAFEPGDSGSRERVLRVRMVADID
jgi:hypothetical protein